jgi:hypothetical protein
MGMSMETFKSSADDLWDLFLSEAATLGMSMDFKVSPREVWRGYEFRVREEESYLGVIEEKKRPAAMVSITERVTNTPHAFTDMREHYVTNESVCYVKPGLGEKLRALKVVCEETDLNMKITEGLPPVVYHANKCHYEGTCVDMNFLGGKRDALAIAEFIKQCDLCGLYAVYEVRTEAEAREVEKLSGLPTGRVIVVPKLKNDDQRHFSVYDSKKGFAREVRDEMTRRSYKW